MPPKILRGIGLRAWSEEEFFKLTVSSKHPCQEQAIVPDESLLAIGEILSTEPGLWVARQKLKAKILARRRLRLAKQQKQVTAELPETVARVVQDKQIVLNVHLVNPPLRGHRQQKRKANRAPIRISLVPKILTFQ